MYMIKTNTQTPGKKSRFILIKGAGDLASGVAHRLYMAGFNLLITEKEIPTVVRRTVSFARATREGKATVEGVTAVKASAVEEIVKIWDGGQIPLLVDPGLMCLRELAPEVLIEGTMAKKNTGIDKSCAPVVIALGPGYRAGKDAHAVVETARGHYLGKVIYRGEASPDTGVPGEVEGYAAERLLRAPVTGKFQACSSPGDPVEKGQTVALVEGIPVKTKVRGVLRGLLYNGLQVKEGMKVGDVDPRAKKEYCFTISDKSRAVAGGVLEAILRLSRNQANS